MGNCFISEEKKEEIKTINHPSPLKLHEVLSISKAIHEAAGYETGVLRIKMVVSKQELKDVLMNKSCVISVCDDVLDDEKRSCMDWKPSLQSIPEGYDLF